MTGAALSPSAGMQFSADPQGFRELLKATADFDKVLSRNVRRGIRDASKTVAAKAQAEVRSGSYTADEGLRDGIARGIRVQISTSARQPGVRIVATGAGLPDGKKNMANVWEHDSFRHPVFGHDAWVEQPGHRYFFRTIYDNRATVTDAVTKAMQQAATELGASVR